MARRFYPAVLERDQGGVFALWFPDFPGAVAAAHIEEEALSKGEAALAAALQDLAERDQPLPAPTPLALIERPAGVIAVVALGATPPNPSERVNVYLPGALLARADALAEAWGMTRSSLFGLALNRLLVAPGGFLAGPAEAPKRARRKR